MKLLYTGKLLSGCYAIDFSRDRELSGRHSVSYSTLERFLDAIYKEARGRKIGIEIAGITAEEDVKEILAGIKRKSIGNIEDITLSGKSLIKKRKRL